MLATWGCSTFPKPTLSLDFAGATSLDDRITFTRGSQATLFDSTGTLVYAKHNLFTYSEDFADAAWVKSSSSVTNDVAIAPDGSMTADKLIEAAATNAHLIGQNASFVSGATYTGSVYLKAGEKNWTRVGFPSSAFPSSNRAAAFDLSNGTIGEVQSGVVANIFDAGNGWYRCSITATANATASNTSNGLAVNIQTSNSATSQSYAGDGTSGLFIWGAQLNLANMEGGVTSSLTTYYPTTTAAYYAPRFDYNPSTLQPLGLLIEEARTNSIRNNTMQGAVAGTPGTNPTNWAVTGAGGNITSSEIVSVTTESGINAIDYKYVFSGAATANIRQDSTTLIAASNGQTWTASAYAKLAGGTLSNCTVSIAIQQYNSGGTVLNTESQTFTPTGSGLATQRISVTKTLDQATVAYVIMRLSIVASGAADITLRIGLPQLEQGAFATSVIPTTTDSVTRNVDDASMVGTNFSSWYRADEGTLYAEGFIHTAPANTAFPCLMSIDNNTTSNRIQLSRANSSGTPVVRLVVVDAGSVQATVVAGNSQFQNGKIAGAYKVNDFAASLDGAAAVTDSAGTVPVVTQMQIGSGTAVQYLNGTIRKLAYYPQRLTNAQLQALTG